MDDLVLGADGRPRCGWAGPADDYVAYHDHEWGRPVHGDAALFERITLEAFQSGLSWLTILRKRDNFRSAFAAFDIEAVAAFGPRDVERLMSDTGIVRNRRKIEATVTNAVAALELRERGGDDALDQLVWSFAEPPGGTPSRPRRLADLASSTDASKALSKALKAAGFVFVGPTTMHAAMQACGLVDDHLEGCHVVAAPGATGGASV
jgi:DNA-3-methyladenine glycosylase I